MQVYVTKDNQRLGPYTPNEVRSRMATGHLIESDLAWHGGLINWLPLGQLLASMPVGTDAPPPIPRTSSGLAKASFIIAMVGIGAWFVLFLAAGLGVSAGARDTSPWMVSVGLFMFAGMGGNLTATVLGIVALAKNGSSKWMAVTGVVVNVVELAGVLFLMVLGMAQKSS